MPRVRIPFPAPVGFVRMLGYLLSKETKQMGSGEKKVVAVLAVVLVGLIVAYFKFQPQPGAPATPMMGRGTGMPGASSGASGAACATSGSTGEGVPTQEFGKKGAKLEIVAALPITHGCHVQTEAELKKAYQKHKDQIHLTIYDLFGPEGQAYVAKHGGQRAVVFINGASSFTLGGKKLVLEKLEGGTYQPSQILPIIEQELKKG